MYIPEVNVSMSLREGLPTSALVTWTLMLSCRQHLQLVVALLFFVVIMLRLYGQEMILLSLKL